MTFTCPYFLLKSDGGLNEKGQSTLRYAYLNRYAPNTTTHLHYLIFRYLDLAGQVERRTTLGWDA